MLRTSDEAYLRMLEEKSKPGEIANIELAEIHLLEEQYFYMNGYLKILNIRISRVK